MPDPLIVSSRGQITLPAAMRKRLGIKGGDVVTLEHRGNELILKPAVIVEIHHYSDEEIEKWDDDDRLDDGERARILDAVSRSGR